MQGQMGKTLRWSGDRRQEWKDPVGHDIYEFPQEKKEKNERIKPG